MQTDLFTGSAEKLDIPDADIVYREGFLANPQPLYEALLKEIAWRQDTIVMYGKPVQIPRLNAWYGDPDASYSYSGLALDPLPWTDTLLRIKAEVEGELNQRFNSVLANLYRDGNDSVGWHSDDEPELGDQPLIASVSLGAERRFSLRHRKKKSRAPIHIDLAPGSLFVMRGITQRDWHHCVAKTKRDVGGRINLTFRQILRVRP